MNKKVKITAIALVVIVLLVILVTCFSNKEDTNNINETTKIIMSCITKNTTIS